jgi:hypothetical protein
MRVRRARGRKGLGVGTGALGLEEDLEVALVAVLAVDVEVVDLEGDGLDFFRFLVVEEGPAAASRQRGDVSRSFIHGRQCNS